MKYSGLKQVVILPILLMVLGLVGCNTMEGFGKDLKKVGSEIEEKADKATDGE